ncbi:LytTR family DNA-binding domain-containing protein [uncultured Ruegeria sp.]|uniref:LytTR family DNA-binding domain-containing protein n=1 Tax=uncultured Ruegeria sp. TaxID=259304 RepID=UPI00260C7378|nr:LytTR family DNA-binding domain-containing protein [uncultured Ruegeria sp.]
MKLKDVYLRLQQAEITFVVLPGISTTLTLHEVFSFFLSRNFFLFLAPLMLMLSGATPSLFAMPLDGMGRAIYWVFCLLGYLALAFVMLTSQAACSTYLGFDRFFTPLTCLPIAYGGTQFAEHAATEVFNTIFSLNFVYMPLFLPQYCLILGVELIVIVWVLPAFLSRSRAGVPEQIEQAPTAINSGGVVSANGQSFLVKDILYVQANQHYVTVRLDEKEALVRSTFKGILSQIPCGRGLQVHRSFWVSRRGVDLASSLNDPDSIVLTCGTRIAVARSRQSAVRAWLTDMAANT